MTKPRVIGRGPRQIAMPARGKRRNPEQNGNERNLRHGDEASPGQLSRIQRVKLSSLTSPAATASMTATASASDTANSTSFSPRKVTIARNAIRSLPSTKGWFSR